MTKYTTYIILAISLWACGPDATKDASKNTEVEPVVENTTAPINKSDTIQIIATGANMSEMKFDVKAIRVPANKEITVALKNESTDATMPHNIVFIQKGTANDVGQGGLHHKENSYVNPEDKNVIAHSPLAQIDEIVYFTFTTPAIGDYEFICSYPGHWGMMKGKFLTR
ncbi:plastocyanin/azurin family copper-binding protein [Bacteroidia bacterium]|nr:plastocyanin/azurin family copper-binding protein [Bacteroidia bacterium]